MDHHLDAGEGDGNRRNGYGKKTVTGEALRQLKRDDPNVENIEHRQAKYLNNRIEADQAAVPGDAQVQVDEDSLRHHQRLRGDADDP